MTDYSELKRLAEAANAVFPLDPWAYEPHGDSGTFGVGVLHNDSELAVTGRQESGVMLVVEPVATDVLQEQYAAFIAACSPGVILGLLAALESKTGFLDDFVQAHQSLTARIDQLKAENDHFRALMAAVAKEIPRSLGHRLGNAPGHSHSIPGIWDSDNGAKAGTECGWCKVWNAATAMAKEPSHD